MALDNTTAHGSLNTGYAIHVPVVGESASVGFPSGGITPPPPPPIPTGACCVDDTCSITTSGTCLGTYQGDDTTCLPDTCTGPPPPPPSTGACCVDGSCSITSEADCTGDYQGNDTI